MHIGEEPASRGLAFLELSLGDRARPNSATDANTREVPLGSWVTVSHAPGVADAAATLRGLG